ncbi:hypothetical protein [Marinobacter salarius]|uniref:hypothetical protein n=1 Tax=Marinobacter salarius TaxID=1420917 RepID=UPI000A1F0302|nr:hypothetical protein [Marinobacter salarius]
MTVYYQIEPEVAGGWGENTRADTSVHPPVVHSLHYEFEGWLGDELLESFPCFLVSEQVGQALLAANLAGFSLEQVEISLSPQFLELQERPLPPRFYWLRITGHAGQADFGISESNLLVVSEQALEVLRRFSLNNAEAAEWKC